MLSYCPIFYFSVDTVVTIYIVFWLFLISSHIAQVLTRGLQSKQVDYLSLCCGPLC